MRFLFLPKDIYGNKAVVVPILRLWLTAQIQKLECKLKS